MRAASFWPETPRIHTHQSGGQGLNLGIQDAVNLGWKLASVLHGHSPSLLDTYHRERHPVARSVLQRAKAGTALIKPGDQIDAVRKVLADLLSLPPVVRLISAEQSGLGVRYPFGVGDHHPLVGRRMPNLELSTELGETSVFALLRSNGFVLLNLGADLPADIPEIPGVHRVSATCLSGEEALTIPDLGIVPALTAALIRPDGYVVWATALPAIDDDGLIQSLRTWATAA